MMVSDCGSNLSADVVAVTEDIPKHGLRRGEVGTVVERWKDGAYEVEFSDDSGE